MSSAPGPTGRLRLVTRPDLIARLSDGLAQGIVLVSAPAGSGKTVLIRSWLETSRARAAWVSVPRAERDAQQFWISVLDAVGQAAGFDVVGVRAASPRFDGRAVVDRLVRGLTGLSQPLVLVIDDLHELVSVEALRQLEDLLAELPPLLRVVLSFRGHAGLGLHRQRLGGTLTEIRASDLVFSVSQTRDLLHASGVELSDADLRSLHDRTEGWPAGIRLAALSLIEHPEPARFVAEFSGTERTIASYLLAEVLERQPPEVRRLLLRTSLLERVSGSLADAVSGGTGSEAILQRLEDAGAFVSSLDTGRSWFRYHHLFADLLRLELRRTASEELPGLHAAAAKWFAAHGEIVEAVRHTQASGDWPMAVRLMSEHYFSLSLDGREETARVLLKSFPRDDMAADPELSLVLAGDELAQGSLDAAAAHLELAVRHAESVPANSQYRFAVTLALVRLSLTRRRGDFDSVLDLIPDIGFEIPPQNSREITMHNDLRAWALLNLGIVETWSGRPLDGANHLEEARALARQIGRPYLEVSCLAHWAATVMWRSFVAAEAASREAIALAQEHGWRDDPVIGPALVTLAVAMAQSGRLEEAERWLEQAEEVLRPELEPAVGFLLFGLQTGLHLWRGRPEQALQSWARAEKLRGMLVSPPNLDILIRSSALNAELELGHIATVEQAITNMSDEERDLGEVREVSARLALAAGSPEHALDALAPILDGSAPVHHVSVVIRALVLRAQALHQLGESESTEAAIERALNLAEPDGLVMPFALSPSRALLERHPRHRTAHGAFISDILDVIAETSQGGRGRDTPAGQDILTEVEVRVLRILPTNFTAPQIAAALYLSTNTVKTHMRHIYMKLGVHTRAEVVARARSLGLLGPSRHIDA